MTSNGQSPFGTPASQPRPPFPSQSQPAGSTPAATPRSSSVLVTAAWIVAAVVLSVIVGGGAAIAANQGGGSGGGVAGSGELTSAPISPSAPPEAASGQATDQALDDSAQRSEIYRNSEDYDFLGDRPGGLMPGGEYFTEPDASGESSSCSTGWMVTKDDQPGRVFMLTAGHCVTQGEAIYYQDESGTPVRAGVAVMSTGEDLDHDLDYALIDVTDAPAWSPNIPVNDSVQVEGWRDAAWAEESNPYVCRIGYRSGLSCGAFLQRDTENIFRYENISDHGDSGGPVWAYDSEEDAWFAVGVTSFGVEEDATNAGALSVGPMMDRYGLTLIAAVS